MKNSPHILKHNAGLTLIEVLVTIIILAVGLLGMAAMQLTGIRSSNGSGYRTQASIFATDIIERMRANPTAVENNLFLSIDSATDINCNIIPDPYCDESFDGTNTVAAASCDSTELRDFDINVWFCGEVNSGARVAGLQANLPQASATIECNDSDGGVDGDDCTAGSTHTVNVSWIEPNPQRNGPDTITQTISITMQP